MQSQNGIPGINSHRIEFRILVRFFDEQLIKVVMKHNESVKCILVNSLSLSQKNYSLFKHDDLP